MAENIALIAAEILIPPAVGAGGLLIRHHKIMNRGSEPLSANEEMGNNILRRKIDRHRQEAREYLTARRNGPKL